MACVRSCDTRDSFHPRVRALALIDPDVEQRLAVEVDTGLTNGREIGAPQLLEPLVVLGFR